eukprot:TRINITY_DN33802_c0_g1_i1.p1 TRINITY_DN33802_c0_g1~~TRINITY_DN33802_c0_g1_i1.p1  ORF type:complete len:915 (+),score=245.25 TRINITY_DN33802_c0_g1_i1:177-2921(+)
MTNSVGGGRAQRWCNSLLHRDVQDPAELGPFSTWRGSLNEPNQRVIRADVERTRGDVEFFRQAGTKAKMEAMLTCWCQRHETRYKQGLNEVLAPFLYLQCEPSGLAGEAAPSDDTVFQLFSAFVDRYVPFFECEDFVPLQSGFVFFRRLLLYHHPDLHNLLVDRGISPDMFCTPWFLTLFASKTPLKLTYLLWDRLLEKADPTFFVFLAVAVLAGQNEAIFAAERSRLPEILTSLGVSSREHLEGVWYVAEGLQRTTPATYSARLRRNVLRPNIGQQQSAKSEDKGGSAEDVLDRLEKEKCFFILPDEVVGHCYPPKLGEARQPWHPTAWSTWRLLVLDLRPAGEFEDARLPAALHFELESLLSVQPPGAEQDGASSGNGNSTDAANARGSWTSAAGAAGRRLLQSLGNVGGSSRGNGRQFQPEQVFEALKATLGEDWVKDSKAHICLVGSLSCAALVRSLYEVLTQKLSLPHVSVASGGHEAVFACARKHGFEVLLGDEVSSGAVPSKGSGGLPSAQPGAADREGSHLAALQSAAGSAWSGLRKQAEAAAEAATAAAAAAAGAGAPGGIVQGPYAGGGQAAEAVCSRPDLLDRPGNWQRSTAGIPAKHLGLRQLPGDALLRGGARIWRCVAVVVSPSFAAFETGEAAAAVAAGDSSSSPWAGCRCCLRLLEKDDSSSSGGKRLALCLEDPLEQQDNGDSLVTMLADLPVKRIRRVTARRNIAEALLFYFQNTATKAGSAAAAPDMVLYFLEGREDARQFVSELRLGHESSGGGVRKLSAESEAEAEAAAAPAGEAAAAAVAVAGSGGGEDAEATATAEADCASPTRSEASTIRCETPLAAANVLLSSDGTPATAACEDAAGTTLAPTAEAAKTAAPEFASADKDPVEEQGLAAGDPPRSQGAEEADPQQATSL